jgi:hypothetical protein
MDGSENREEPTHRERQGRAPKRGARGERPEPPEGESDEDIAAMVLGSKFGKGTASPLRHGAERPSKRRRRL